MKTGVDKPDDPWAFFSQSLLQNSRADDCHGLPQCCLPIHEHKNDPLNRRFPLMDYKAIVMQMILLYVLLYTWGLILDFTKTAKDWGLPLPSSPHLPVDSSPQVSPPFLVPLIPYPPPECLPSPATSFNLGISFLDPHSTVRRGPMSSMWIGNQMTLWIPGATRKKNKSNTGFRPKYAKLQRPIRHTWYLKDIASPKSLFTQIPQCLLPWK